MSAHLRVFPRVELVLPRVGGDPLWRRPLPVNSLHAHNVVDVLLLAFEHVHFLLRCGRRRLGRPGGRCPLSDLPVAVPGRRSAHLGGWRSRGLSGASWRPPRRRPLGSWVRGGCEGCEGRMSGLGDGRWGGRGGREQWGPVNKEPALILILDSRVRGLLNRYNARAMSARASSN